ncbi:endogenous retrovirus group K member 18 Pol protein-like protein [Turdus rufiventris]|nr:endogenous retrovirus group K member 18 Pol protein-like protein [Turdus rufiventris]
MEPMGALQPGLPNPAMIPQDWPILVVDLQDCFFTIPLHPEDTKRFAFTVPSLNKGEPDKRFEWTTLPQGMRNSPTICQLFVDLALQPICSAFPNTVIYHYMDDILFAQPAPFCKQQIDRIVSMLLDKGLQVSQEKIQIKAPWKYLGWTIADRQVRPQKLNIQTTPSTLHEAQKLLGDLQWLKPVVGIPNTLLESLRPLLKGTDPCAPVHLSPSQLATLQKIAWRIASGFVTRYDPRYPIDLIIWNSSHHLLGAVTQKTGESTMGILEWISPHLQQRKTITQKTEKLAELLMKGHLRIIELSGQEPATIYLPIEKQALDWFLLNSSHLADSLLGSPSLIVTTPLAPKELQWLGNWSWIIRPIREDKPIPRALTIFTDAGKRSKTAVATWKAHQEWKHHIIPAEKTDSLQTLELLAVCWALQTFSEPVNIVSDSLYVVGIVARIEDSSIKEVQNPRLGQLLAQLQRTVQFRQSPYAIIHIRSHKWPVGLGEGNDRADKLVALQVPQALSREVAARESHNIFHQNAKGLSTQFKIPLKEAQAIVRACPVCSYHNGGTGIGLGVNPRGTGPNQLWQMDVTHVPEFGKQKYVHVTIDTYSHYIWATAQTGEKAHHVERHLNSCFAVMGLPHEIKTDNGPAYISQRLKAFLNFWNVTHVTGNPNVPTGQAIVERANGTLKNYLKKYSEPHDLTQKLNKVLFVLNHLSIFANNTEPPVIIHFEKQRTIEAPKVYVRYPLDSRQVDLTCVE